MVKDLVAVEVGRGMSALAGKAFALAGKRLRWPEKRLR